MSIGSANKSWLPLVILFLSLSVFFFTLNSLWPGSAVDYRVLAIGNLLLFILSLISARLSLIAMGHKSVQVFLRLVYGSFILKFFVIAIVAFLYIIIFKKQLNKPALFGCIALYFIYTAIELRSVLKQSKQTHA